MRYAGLLALSPTAPAADCMEELTRPPVSRAQGMLSGRNNGGGSLKHGFNGTHI